MSFVGFTCANTRHIYLKHITEDLELSGKKEVFLCGEGASGKCEVVMHLKEWGAGGMLFHNGRNFKMKEDERSDNVYSQKLPIQLLGRALTETKVPI